MLAAARERHPAQSVGQIGLLSSPFRPGGGGEGLGERGGKNKALKLLQSKPARPLKGRVFEPPALIGPAQAATENIAILALKPATPTPTCRASPRRHPTQSVDAMPTRAESIRMKLVRVFALERGVKGFDGGHVRVKVARGLKDGA